MKQIITLLSTFLAAAASSQTPFYPSADATGSGFGSVTAISGANIASVTTANVYGQHGRLYLFDVAGGTVSESASFLPDDVSDQDGFGETVALSDTFCAVGPSRHDLTPDGDQGAVFIYRQIDGTWQYFQGLLPPPDATTAFGKCVKLDGDTLFVADNGDMAGSSSAGAIYVFHFDGSGWSFSQKLTVAGTHNLGSSLDIDGDKLLAFSADDSGAGALHTFIFDGWAWNYTGDDRGDPEFCRFQLIRKHACGHPERRI